MDHTPLPDNYYTNDLWQDSPLTDDERESLRDEIRQLVLGIKEDTGIRELSHSAISEISLICFRDEETVSIDVYLDTDEIEADPIGNETFDEKGNSTVSSEMHFLRDLGQEWEALEYDIISELVLMLDLPEMPEELSNYLLDGTEYGPNLLCTSRHPGFGVFSISATIPETTQKIYDDAEFELARKLNIPIDGSSK